MKEMHPEIMLIDYDGNEISWDSNAPYTPQITRGGCHDYEHRYQFLSLSAGSHLISRGMYGKCCRLLPIPSR